MTKSVKPPKPQKPEVQSALPHECVVSAEVQAAAALEPWASKVYGKADIGELVRETRDSMRAISDGNMRPLEAMLYGQAMVLQGIFVNLSRRAANQEYLQQFQAHLSLALKAQAQCRATVETLAEMRRPRSIAIVQQANIAQGPQQVNNGLGVPVPAEKSPIAQNELLEARHEQPMDTRTTGTAGRAHSPLEALAEIDGTANDSRQG